MSAFVYEIANVHEAVKRAHPGHAEGVYAVPFYLILGEPGSGRSAALHAMNLTWDQGDGPLRIGLPEQLATYWMPKEAVFIEPEAQVLGPKRNPRALSELAEELKKARPREAVDGILLILSIADFIDLDERATEDYASRLRTYLVEVGRVLAADVPVYVMLTRYDTMWGFAEVFQWTPDRKKEDPWGFTLPNDTDSQKSLPRIQEELVGLAARFEAFCLAKLSSEDPPEARIRAFQHLAEVRMLMERIGMVFKVLFMANAYERAPWVRAVTIGSAMPGAGDRLRAGILRFRNMGLMQGASAPASVRPGGLPFHAFMQSVVLPERDIVPLATRWRDDRLVVWLSILGGLILLAAVVVGIVFAATGHAPPPHLHHGR